ncbi:MAG: hypothetical protein ACRER5_24630, partial [Pseudomonas sp.]
RQPARITINMASSSLDSVLLLLDADSRYLEMDDDSGSGCDALITRELEAGTYAILANTYQAPSACGANKGPYRLQVSYQSTEMPLLGRSVSLQGQVAAAGFRSGITTDGGTTWRNVIGAGQRFDAIGRIDIDPLHVGLPGFIVTAVVMEDGQLLIKHPQLGFISYDPATTPSQLGAVKTLAATETVDILRGATGAELGFSRIAVGFMVGYGLLGDPQELYFHAEPISLVINP